MANKRGYGSRQSASVPAGDYRGYKRAIEERRRSMNADDDSARYDNYVDENAYSDNDSDEMMAAVEDAYEQSAGQTDDDLNAVYNDGAGEQNDDEDEEAMSAPRRRARAYRSGANYSQNGKAQKAKGELEESARPARPARSAKPAASKRPAKRVAQEEYQDEDLTDYTSEENSYSDAVYEPYDPDEDDGDYENENASVTEWSDGIKRALSKGKAGWLALKAKANAGGKKHPPQKKKRPQQHKPAAIRKVAVREQEPEEHTDDVLEPITPLQPAAREANAEPTASYSRADISEYESVSAELHADEEVKPISRRERRMMQQRHTEDVPTDDYPNVNIVSRKTMRAQQEEKAAAAQAQEASKDPEVAMTTAPMPESEQSSAPQIEQPAPVEPQSAAQEEPASSDGIPEKNPVQEEVPDETQGVAQDEGMMFGVKGRTHIMQSQHDFGYDEPEGDFDRNVEETQQPMPQPAARDESDDDDELESEREHGSKKRSHRERKRQKNNRRVAATADDDDDEDDYRPSEQSIGETTKYKRTSQVQSAHMDDDDDEPEDDYARGRGNSNADMGRFIVPDNGFSDDTYETNAYDEDEDFTEEDDDERSAGGKGGGCLKAFTILLVILLILFGGIWALDYFNVVDIRGIVNNVASMSIFDSLRGSVLPAATDSAESQSTSEITTQDDAQPVATMQPAAVSTDAAPIVTQETTDTQSVYTQPTEIPTQTVALPQNTSTTLLNVESPETYSQANTLRNELSRASTSVTQLLNLKAEPIEGASPDDSKFDLSYSVFKDYDRVSTYSREEPITFGLGEEYTDVEGVITFRGNNFRENASYGTTSLEKKEFKILWCNKIGSIDSGYAKWTGVGWNGQAVMVHWSDELREMMNIRDEFKYDSDLVEVIYGTLDGNIYFLDSRTGEYTRDPIKLGFPIKGSVSIDPRGYPLLYVGQGISKANGKTGSIGWRVYNLLNQEHMYLLNGHDELRYRTHGSFDGVCLLDAETDNIIEGAENGLFYTIKLNTVFDKSVPSITIDPEVSVYRYKSRQSRAVGDDGLGIENSVAAYGQYAYFADNSGLLTCLNLNTMEPAWLFDVGDDTDASISLEQQDDGLVALYTINEVDIQGSTGYTTLRKMNALTGEELWNFSVKCKSDGTNGGGGFASPAMGKGKYADLIFFNVCRTEGGGTLYAFNKETGEIVWQKSTTRYSWSSPVLVYNDNGDAVLIVGNSGGVLRMYDPLTGDVYDEIELDGNMEGSPAVYGDTLVIGTRDCRIYGVQIQ